jgi:DNA gyrase subunit A
MVVGVDFAVAKRKPQVMCVSRKARVLVCAASEITYLSGPGRGVTLIKLDEGDQLMALKVAHGPDDTLSLKTTLGGEQKVSFTRFESASRGGKGRDLVKRGQISEVLLAMPVLPQLTEPKST